MKPLIVVASKDDEVHRQVNALRACGVPADEIRVLLPEDAAETREQVRGARGLLVAGGNDLAPSLYGEEEVPDSRVTLELGRDQLDFEALAGARQSRVPTWGICRGVQSLNVFLGGTLWQDLPTQRGGTAVHELEHPLDALAHEVEIREPDSPTGQVLGREPALVNSRHHQAIKDLAPGLVEIARSPDGVVEAVELTPGHDDLNWWVRGVQWHPEDLLALPQQRALWREFLTVVNASGEPTL